MAVIHHRFAEPYDAKEASEIIVYILRHPLDGSESVRASLREWSPRALHLLVQELKSTHYYSHGNVLGASLRSLANTAAILEHRKSIKKT